MVWLGSKSLLDGRFQPSTQWGDNLGSGNDSVWGLVSRRSIPLPGEGVGLDVLQARSIRECKIENSPTWPDELRRLARCI